MNARSTAPFDPPIVTRDLPGTGGAIGNDLDDFVVDEVPLYPFSGEGEHLFVRFQKRGMTSRDAVFAISRAAGVPASDIGTAGMKDKHAVTSQWASLLAKRATPPESWELPAGLVVLETARHGNKLRTGHAKGNHFTIRLTGVSSDSATNAHAIVTKLRATGLPNFFGGQRFGHRGENVNQAFAWLEGGHRVKRFEQKLFSSVVQSEVFNRYLAMRLEEPFDAPLAGEVVRLSTSSAVFVVEEPANELPRWETHDIVPTGPMIGPKMRAAKGRPLEMEENAVREAGLADAARQALGRFADGTRRDALLWLEDVRVTPAENALVVEFFLPAGSYATQLVRELTREPFILESRGVARDAPGGEIESP
jgi:tRNA pseudouridine13 synthase